MELMDAPIYYKTQVLWSMLDINGHLRHSAYADIAAQARINMLLENNVVGKLKEMNLGPIIFREELLYFKEIRANEFVEVTAALTKYRNDGARYSIQNVIFRSDGTKCAEINIDGAWLDLKTRKLGVIPKAFEATFLALPKSHKFEITQNKEKINS